ncbi:MAG: hypothetical protein ACOCWM_01810, partial [Cyclobacteriaceae bacterium]
SAGIYGIASAFCQPAFRQRHIRGCGTLVFPESDEFEIAYFMAFRIINDVSIRRGGQTFYAGIFQIFDKSETEGHFAHDQYRIVFFWMHIDLLHAFIKIFFCKPPHFIFARSRIDFGKWNIKDFFISQICFTLLFFIPFTERMISQVYQHGFLIVVL